MNRIPEAEVIAEMESARRFNDMMGRSKLEGWRIVEDFIDLMVVKET
jgi:hypothetical protein